MGKINTATATVIDVTPVDEIGSVEVVPTVTKEKLYDVNISKTFKAYIGDRWYYFEKGKMKVSGEVKLYLMDVKALSAF